MDNLSFNDTLLNSEANTFRYVTNSIYIIIGFFGIICNGLVLLMSARVKQNHGILILGLALADFINSLGYFCYGLRGLVIANMKAFLMTPFQCMLEGIHISLFELGEATSSWLTMFVSLDRLIAIVWICRYRTLGRTYVSFVKRFICIYSFADLVVSWIGSAMLEQKQIYTPRCGHPQSVPKFYYTWHTIQMICCGFLSIVLYLSALIAMKAKRNISSIDVHAVHIKREVAVTKRIAIVILTTFFLQVLPSTIYATNVGDLYFFDIIGPYVWALYALTPSVNVFVYSIRTPEFLTKIKSLTLLETKLPMTRLSHKGMPCSEDGTL